MDSFSGLSYPSDMADELTIQINLRPQDIYDPVRDLLQYSWWNCFRWAFLLFATYLVYETYPLWSTVDSETKPALFVLALFFLSILLTLFLFPYLRVRSTFRESPVLRNTRTLSFNAEGIRVESEDGRGNYKWSLFPQIFETPRVFIFAQSSHSAGGMYVPKRCFSAQDDIARLRGLIRANCTGKARLRPD